MARIRAANWGDEEYWTNRISGYIDGKLHPRDALKPRVVFVGHDGVSVVGFIAGHLTRRYRCEGELQWIDVVPELRGKGVAAELLQRLAAWFKAQNAARICVDVQPANVVARRFYMRQGAEVLNDHWLVWKDIEVVLR
jgi:GNAT superfamily N-acetyltransferase